MGKDICDLCCEERVLISDSYDKDSSEYKRGYCKSCYKICEDLIKMKKDKNLEVEQRLYNQMKNRIILV